LNCKIERIPRSLLQGVSINSALRGQHQVDQGKIALYSTMALRRELSGFRETTSRLFPDVTLDQILTEVTICKMVKDSVKRQVFYLQAPFGNFFLKRIVLIRDKDRLRHLLLPGRRWAEWRNLHKLGSAGIAAARPVLKGEKRGVYPEVFFLVTQKVEGCALSCESLAIAETLGRYIALLHLRGVYHADLHPENLIIQNNGQPCLIDVQEVLFLPWLPHRIRVCNLGKLYFRIRSQLQSDRWSAAFLRGYNNMGKNQITPFELNRAADRHQQIHYRSRSKRCCKNSTEFAVVKGIHFHGYKRRSFYWGRRELRQALEEGKVVKKNRVINFQGVNIKIHYKRIFHKDRCLASWKISRALEVRNIAVPQSLAYFVMNGYSFFLSEFIVDSILLNDYLSSLSAGPHKRRAIKKLALWVKQIHDNHIWQRDFKSSNILCRKGDCLMVDLDDVTIRGRLPDKKKIVNLAQLNASLSNAITIKDRLRFFYYYMADEKPSRQRRRTIYRKVWAITSSKDTSYFDLDIDKLKI
jgi:tRNA A-37 threonylcarbamoyl transferase component Bud32